MRAGLRSKLGPPNGMASHSNSEGWSKACRSWLKSEMIKEIIGVCKVDWCTSRLMAGRMGGWFGHQSVGRQLSAIK